jgi:hypothetical protein
MNVFILQVELSHLKLVDCLIERYGRFAITKATLGTKVVARMF